jgi:hypothetical protein
MKKQSKADKALAACREYSKIQDRIKELTRFIGSEHAQCNLVTLKFDGIGDPPEWKSHLMRAYEPEVVENDWGHGTHKDWLAPDDVVEAIKDCPHCLAAHEAIQARKGERRKLGIVKRRITLLGKTAAA